MGVTVSLPPGSQVRIALAVTRMVEVVTEH
jgi:hypothetical protein